MVRDRLPEPTSLQTGCLIAPPATCQSTQPLQSGVGYPPTNHSSDQYLMGTPPPACTNGLLARGHQYGVNYSQTGSPNSVRTTPSAGASQPLTRIDYSQTGGSKSIPTTPTSAHGLLARGCQSGIDSHSQTGSSKEYCTLRHCGTKLSQAMSRAPQSLAIASFEAGIIPRTLLEETLEVLVETRSTKGYRLYCATLKVIESFPHKFADFMNILRRNQTLYDDIIIEIDRVYNAI